MTSSPLTITSFPRAILHIDGDAFFASCEQARDPSLRGKPVITGKERGIASSMSYEAKECGVKRGMSFSQIKRVCPGAIFLPADYETYSILSARFYAIIRRYTPDVEEYGIDECFADITGLRRLHRTSYENIARKIKDELDTELGFTFSVGLGPNKSIAKIGSKWKKPSGLTAIPGKKIHHYLADIPIEKIWGIGAATTAFLHKHGITTALQFALKNEGWITTHLSKPFVEIWQELNGKHVLQLETDKKSSFASIQKVKTFTPPSDDRDFVFSQLCKNIENACMKARRYKLAAKEIAFFLRTQEFSDTGLRLKFAHTTAFPNEIITAVNDVFDTVFKENTLYRSTGIWLIKLQTHESEQLDLFGTHQRVKKMSKLFTSMDHIRKKYGKHTLFLGLSFYANKFSQHLGERGDAPVRTRKLLPGETKRKRLGIPMFIGDVD